MCSSAALGVPCSRIMKPSFSERAAAWLYELTPPPPPLLSHCFRVPNSFSLSSCTHTHTHAYTHCRYFALLPKDETRQLELKRQQSQGIRMRLELASTRWIIAPTATTTCDHMRSHYYRNSPSWRRDATFSFVSPQAFECDSFGHLIITALT